MCKQTEETKGFLILPISSLILLAGSTLLICEKDKQTSFYSSNDRFALLL